MTHDRDTDTHMNGVRITRRQALMGGVLVGASAFAYARMPEANNPVIDQDSFVSWVPNNVGNWRDTGMGDVVLPTPDSLSGRLYDNLVTRTYVQDRQVIMLSMVYNNIQDGMIQVHRPEVCYPVGGFELSDGKETTLAMGGEKVPASRFTAVGRGRVEHIEYFTRVGKEFPRTWTEQKLSVMRANLRGVIPDGMMVRLSSIDPDENRAFASLQDFASGFFEASAEPLRKLMVNV